MNPATNDMAFTIRLPSDVYSELLSLQTEEAEGPSEIIAHLVRSAHQRRAWIDDLTMLRYDIKKQGGLRAGETEDDIVENLRKTRKEIFKSDYAHLYR